MRHFFTVWMLLFTLFYICSCIPSCDSKPIGNITSQSLWFSYDRNEVRADEWYKGKVYCISGKVEKIGKDILGTPYVVLETESTSWGGVQCLFVDEDKSKVAGLFSGQKIIVHGRISGKLFNVLVLDCRLQ